MVDNIFSVDGLYLDYMGYIESCIMYVQVVQKMDTGCLSTIFSIKKNKKVFGHQIFW